MSKETISKVEEKEILRLMELCYDFGKQSVKTGLKVRLLDLYEEFKPRLLDKR